MAVFLPGQGSCSLSLALQLSPVAPKRCFNFVPILRRYGSKHRKIDWKEKKKHNWTPLWHTDAEGKTGIHLFFPVVDTNKVSWRQIQISYKQELPRCLWKTKLTGLQDHFPPAYMQSASLVELETTPSGLKNTCPESVMCWPKLGLCKILT